jgi:hypothetical protein
LLCGLKDLRTLDEHVPLVAFGLGLQDQGSSAEGRCKGQNSHLKRETTLTKTTIDKVGSCVLMNVCAHILAGYFQPHV